MFWREPQPGSFVTTACAVNGEPNLNPKPFSVQMTFIQTRSKRAVPGKPEGRRGHPAWARLTPCQHLDSHLSQCSPSETQSTLHLPGKSFSPASLGFPRTGEVEGLKSRIRHCPVSHYLLPVRRGKPLSHLLILPTSSAAWATRQPRGGYSPRVLWLPRSWGSIHAAGSGTVPPTSLTGTGHPRTAWVRTT